MTTSSATRLEIEEHALLAWPAAEVEAYEGWQMRAMHGVSRRANSVWTARATGPHSFQERVEHAESFYRARGLPPCFQVGEQSEPAGLDGALDALGYALDAPVSVQVARASLVAAQLGRSKVRVEVEDQLTEDWFDVSARRGRFVETQDEYRGLLLRLGRAALFATAFIDEAPVAVGLGVSGGQWLGISSMLTLAEYRGRGAARSVLLALADAAQRQRGTPSLYLQVERDNAPAAALYAKLGFTEHHGYHYRIRH